MQKIFHPNARIALILFGIHYAENYKHWMQWTTNIDFRKSVENYKKYLFDYFEKQQCYVDVFCSTYISNIIPELVKIYCPKKIITCDFINSGKNHSKFRKERLVNGLKIAIETNNNDYNWYLLTRFDLYFLKQLEELNILNNQLNISYRSKLGADCGFDDDNFYLIPQNIAYKCLEIFANHPSDIWMHELHKYAKDLKINYMIDGCYWSHESPLYKIIR